MLKTGIRAGLSAAVVMAVGLGGALVGPAGGPARATTYGNVYTVTQTWACGPQGQPDPVGSFVWAIWQANLTPGLDEIVLPKDGHIDFSGCFGDAGPVAPFRAQALDSVDIVGDNTTLDGGNMWFNDAGLANPIGACPRTSNGSVLMSQSGGVLEVGDQSGTPVANVSITGVTMQGLSVIATVQPNSRLTIENSTVQHTQDILADCHRDPIFVDHGSLVLRGVKWSFTDTPTQNEYSGAIAGVGASVVLDGVDMSFALNGRAINVLGKDSAVYVTSSVVSESGGFRTEANPFYFTNSAFYTDLTQPKQRIDSYDGLFYAVASSFHFGGESLAGALSQHSPGALWMQWSAVGGPVDSEPLIAVEDSKLVFGNYNSWIQPTVNQGRNSLLLTVPGIVLGADGQPGLPTGAAYTAVPPAIAPVVGTTLMPGFLLGFVHDAGPGGVEELKDPLTQAPILQDVFGNPRVDSGTVPPSRDIGAMQVSDEPVLSLVSTTASSATVTWTWGSGTSTGPYEGWILSWHPLNDPGSVWTTTHVDDPSVPSTTLHGLTPGIPYEVKVAGTSDHPAPVTSPYSAPILVVPVGPIEPPTPSATPGQQQVSLFWTEPAPSGHPGPLSYYVVYRPVGATQWIAGPGPISGRVTLIPELTGGTTYEFGVFAASPDGTNSLIGLTTATPTSPPNPPTPSNPAAPPTSTTAPSTPPLTPVVTPQTMAVPPGGTLVLVAGSPTASTSGPTADSTGVQVAAPGWTLTVGGQLASGSPAKLGTGNVLQVATGLKVTAAGTGFKPGTQANVYILEPAVTLGSCPVGVDGSFTCTFDLPSTLAPGGHVLQVNGYTPDQLVRSVSLGLQVTANATKVSKRIQAVVYFGVLSANLDAVDNATLAALVKHVPKKATNVTVQVTGYVQPTSTTSNDTSLSTARARRTAATLRADGLKGRYYVSGEGRSTLRGAQGRRVEIRVAYKVTK